MALQRDTENKLDAMAEPTQAPEQGIQVAGRLPRGLTREILEPLMGKGARGTDFTTKRRSPTKPEEVEAAGPMPENVDADVVEKSSNQDAVTSEQASPNTNKEDDTNEILTILQNKLSAVENECNELQAELVELRSKVDELQRKSEGQENEEEMEVQALKYYRLLPSLGTKTRVTLPIKTSHVNASVPTSHHHLAAFLP